MILVDLPSQLSMVGLNYTSNPKWDKDHQEVSEKYGVAKY